ncbi:Zinc finger protein ZAT11 [Spatholobus suberectus]|nr:Zinc finger protein ZAT11 [Spatholobus suberectus]
MKRQKENEEVENLFMATCLKMVSQARDTNPHESPSREAFECKTCNRKFTSFQALGGHRASHKRPKLEDGEELKPKIHQCSICGQGFSLGQALGGHMRKHRDAIIEGFSSINHDVALGPVLKRSSSSSARTTCLDLNLTPLENGLKLLFGMTTPPKVNISL